MRKIVVLLCIACGSTAFAEDYARIVDTAIANISHDFHESWAFTETTLEDGVEFVGRYNPALPGDSRWLLLSVDGRLPTAQENEDFIYDKRHSFSEDSDSAREDLEIVDRDTLRLIEETDDRWLFSFQPFEDDPDDEEAAALMEEVNGRIKIMRDGHYPAYIEMRNRKPVRPAVSVKISKFLTRLEFGPAGGDGPIVPLSIDVRIRGRAMLVISIDEREATHYSDFTRASP